MNGQLLLMFGVHKCIVNDILPFRTLASWRMCTIAVALFDYLFLVKDLLIFGISFLLASLF